MLQVAIPECAASIPLDPFGIGRDPFQADPVGPLPATNPAEQIGGEHHEVPVKLSNEKNPGCLGIVINRYKDPY